MSFQLLFVMNRLFKYLLTKKQITCGNAHRHAEDFV